jgi:hypothetical protein
VEIGLKEVPHGPDPLGTLKAGYLFKLFMQPLLYTKNVLPF